jgi:hypothetical protein
MEDFVDLLVIRADSMPDDMFSIRLMVGYRQTPPLLSCDGRLEDGREELNRLLWQIRCACRNTSR